MKPRLRDIPGFEGNYQITTEGVVLSLKHGRVQERKSYISSRTGYRYVILTVKGKQHNLLVHRLVLQTFIGPCPVGMEARHFPDPDRTNCRLKNLHWGTRKDNAKDKLFHGHDLNGERGPMAKLSWAKVKWMRKLYLTGNYSQIGLGRVFGISNPAAHKVLTNKTWKE